MAKTFEYSMKIPFDMSDVNGFIKIPQLILLSLQVSGMQSIELGMSDMYILENYNLVWIITDYNMKIERLPVFDEKITIETYAKSHNRLFCYRAFLHVPPITILFSGSSIMRTSKVINLLYGNVFFHPAVVT